jgi:lipopolysaccharide biosynthesis protein
VSDPAQLKARAIAFYLPQYYPIRENDQWWGKGFTEWTNVAKAKPLFKGHYQPHVPADLGFYDLRVPETRQAQADMAREYGIEAFCYWHYWFAGRRILDRPFAEVLASGKPDFPFCLAWANETWSGVWYGETKRILIEQTYPGEEDYRRHFDFLLTAFVDRRYVRVDGKPLMFIYKPNLLPDCSGLINLWRQLAERAGLPGLHMVGFAPHKQWDGKAHGFDAVTEQTMAYLRGSPTYGIGNRLRDFTDGKRGLGRIGAWLSHGQRTVYRYADVVDKLIIEHETADEYYPTVVPNWDNTPRSNVRGWTLHDATPELFRGQFRRAIQQVAALPADHRIVFIKAWNEWAEGNHLEPDLKDGLGFLRAVGDELRLSK